MRSPFRPHSLRTGAAVAFATYGALACAAILACLAHTGQQLATKAAQEKALAIAKTAALSVDGAAHLEVYAGRDEQTLERVCSRQRKIWAAAPAAVILYTMMRPSNGADWRYVATPADGGNRGLRAGDLVRGDYRPLLDRAVVDAVVDPKPYTSAHRTWVRAYAPVRGPDGRAVAVLAVEVPAPTINLLGEARWLALGVIALVVLVGVLVSVLRSWGVIQALRALADASARLARGHHVQPLPVRGMSEIVSLTQSFNQMVAAMNERAREANTDGLTGLYNHRYFQERLAQEVTRASRYSHRVALLMIDIDHFKAFNDRYGHPAGDDVLQQVANAIRGAIRDIDVAARYGGEELVVIMPEADSFTGMEQAELVRLAIRRQHFRIKSDESIGRRPAALDEPEVYVSIGVAECPANASDPESLVAAADLALLRAKQMGRDRVCAYQAINVIEGERDCRELHRLMHQGRAAQLARHSPGDGESGSAIGDDAFTCAHCRSVTRYAMTLAHALPLPKRDAEEVRRAALWLDVNRFRQRHQQEAGSEAAALDTWETRTATSHALLSRTFRTSSVPANVLHMREWYNGQGYPDGLAGEEIPQVARILAVADTYERMLVGNGDAGPLAPAEALAALDGHAGTFLDPRLVTIFRAAMQVSESSPTEIACAVPLADNGQDQSRAEPATRRTVTEEASQDHAASVSA